MSQDVEMWEHELREAGWIQHRLTIWRDPAGVLHRGPYGAWCKMIVGRAPAGQLSLEDWVQERLDNCTRLASDKSGEDKAGWIEDATYFRRILDRLRSPTLPASPGQT